MFIVFEGVDGAGKTTQLNQLVQWLEASGRPVVSCKDPGSTALGEQLRAILLDDQGLAISMRAEMMLFTTARTQLVQEVVRPALDAGKVVVLDRYIYSTIVYQGHAGQLPIEDIRTVNKIATADLTPDLTFIFDLPVEKSMLRLGDDLDRMESRGEQYFQKVRNGFLLESKQNESGFHLINADRTIEEIQTELRAIVSATDRDSHQLGQE